MAEIRDWKQMRDWSVRLLQRHTGSSVEEWNRRVRESGISDEAALRDWLAERGVVGYAQMLLVLERFGYPGLMEATAGDLVAGQYADRRELRPILDRILSVAVGMGEVHVRARKTFVTLLGPRRTFALVRPTTRTRVDLGLRLSGQVPHGRLMAATSLGNDTITVRIGLRSPEEVDEEVAGWLRASYEANA